MIKPAASSPSEIAKKQRKYNLDPDTLECPICSLPFSPPVYQCENGHSACSPCCEKITKINPFSGCPSCSRPTGRIRNVAVEKIIESLEVECKHHGCNTMVMYSEVLEHENELCEYQPTKCPVQRPNCQHIGPKVTMPLHLVEEHDMEIVECPESITSSSFRMKASCQMKVLKAEKAWLLVHCWVDSLAGSNLYCSAFGASKEVAYKLTVEPVMLNIESNVIYSIQTVAQDHLLVDNWKFGYLVIPHKEIERSELEFNMTVSLL